jgi:hypothetical protein
MLATPYRSFRRRLIIAVGVAPLVGFAALAGFAPRAACAAAGVPEHVSFGRDVMAVLSKAGCNQGTCHGNQQGKNGFKLSLRGEDPAADFLALSRDQLGRRVDPLNPQLSLLLQKAIGKVPHGGGRRFAAGSLEYETLLRWIDQGLNRGSSDAPRLVDLKVTPRETFLVAPERDLSIRATATFSDGSQRDATRWAVYSASNPIAAVSIDGRVHGERDGETTILVRYLSAQATVQLALVPERPGFRWQAAKPRNYIDEHVLARLRKLRMNPSPPADDTVFVRRVFADLVGLVPAPHEARSFAESRDPDKRAKLIDRLLERPEFADFWALKWSDLLRNEEKTLDRKGVQAFHHWIRQSIAEGKPLDQFAYELVTARGSTYSRPETNFYRANRDPVSRAEATAQVFLGLRLQCAKCHNHPFDRWTQADYYDWAGFFAHIRYKTLEVRRRDELDKHEFDGEQLVWVSSESTFPNPRTRRPAQPRVLGSAEPSVAEGDDPLETLGRWMIDRRNPFFARVQVNRVWYHLLGRGIVDPVDDFRVTNLPVNEPLLAALAEDFVEHGYDLRHLLRTIANSNTYQLASEANSTNAADEANFSHAMVRPLSAEALLDALHRVAIVPAHFFGYPKGLRAVELPGVQVPRLRRRAAVGGEEQFLVKFGKPPRLLSCECERSEETTLGQAFQLVSGPTINALLAAPGNILGKMSEAGHTNGEVIDELYWRALSRAPLAAERQAMLAHVERSGERRAALEDVLWAIINSKEFLLRH